MLVVIAGQFGAAFGKILLNRLPGGVADGDDPFLGPFAHDADDADGGIQIAQLHRAQFAGPQSAGVEQFEYGHVAKIESRFGIRGGNELIHLRAAEYFRQGLFRLGAVELLKNLGGFAIVAGEKSQHDADGREAAGNGAGGFSASALPVQIFAVIAFVGGLEVAIAVGEEVRKIFEVAAVGVEGVFSQAALSRKMPQQLPEPGLVDARVEGRPSIERTGFHHRWPLFRSAASGLRLAIAGRSGRHGICRSRI